MKQKIKKILLKALRYEWSPRDNSHTASIIVDGWVNEIMELYIDEVMGKEDD